MDSIEEIMDMGEDLVLTTTDNPYNPKHDYDKWKLWDIENGYNTEEYLARIIVMPENIDISNDWVMRKLSNDAVNSILENDTLGIYKLV